jgi:hypothetical protein
LVAEVEERNLPFEAILPALVQLNPEAERVTANRLRRSLATQDEKRQRAALRGIMTWLRNQVGFSIAIRGYRLPRFPEDLLQELGSRVANRRQPGLQLSLEAAISVLRRFPERANRRFIQSLTLGLDYLLEETQYRVDDLPISPIPAANTPAYRRLAAQLAGLLARHPRGRSEVVERWLEVAREDPLPEVRHAVDGGEEVEAEA